MKKLFQFLCLVGFIGYMPISHADSGYIPPPPPPPGSTSDSSRERSSSQSYSITCESNDYDRKTCPVDTGGKNVRLQRQLSRADCIKDDSWGFNSEGIWVDDGCRARFVVDSYRNIPESRSSRIRNTPDNGGIDRARSSRQQLNSSGNVTCASEDYKYNYCRVSTNNQVRLVNQASAADCIENETWGYDNGGIWVDKGCRAEFSLGNSSVTTSTTGGRRDPIRTTVTCESDDYDYKHCDAPVWEGSVRVTRQLSNTACIQDSTWGTTNNGIWVNKGCRAEFTVGR